MSTDGVFVEVDSSSAVITIEIPASPEVAFSVVDETTVEISSDQAGDNALITVDAPSNISINIEPPTIYELLVSTPDIFTIEVGGAGGGVTDHGQLMGLGDDDHPQYHTDARGDARYLQPTEVLPGANITVDRIAVPGSVVISSSGGSGGGGSGEDEVWISATAPSPPLELWVDTASGSVQGVIFYEHSQGVLSKDWIVQHNLGRRPVVQTRDAASSLIYGSVQHQSENQLVVHFSMSLTGTAQCI